MVLPHTQGFLSVVVGCEPLIGPWREVLLLPNWHLTGPGPRPGSERDDRGRL